jgi:two-component system, NarL family, invasion response regulator UvrY
MIKILIADDHAIVREGLKQIVAEDESMHVLGEAGSAAELFNLLDKEEWSIIILDINMPGKNGLEILKEIHTQRPAIPVLVLSMYSEEHYGLRAIKSGAAGYLQKISAPSELVKAILKVVNGGKYISPELAEKIANSFDLNHKLLPHEYLSDREFQIMCQISAGKTADQISKDLMISIHTVYSYRNRILEKMNMKSNIELTRYVMQNKLTDN